tara:strand:- start:1665 stop:2585 length:921 start_codon:yes stop_codon:yes gene_type:complete
MTIKVPLFFIFILLSIDVSGQDSLQALYFPYQIGDRVAYNVFDDNNSGDRIFEYRLDITGEEPREALVVIGGSYSGFGLFDFYQDSSNSIKGIGIFEGFEPWIILDLSKTNEINSPWISYERNGFFELGIVQNKTFKEVFFQKSDSVIGVNIFQSGDSTETEGLDRFYQEWSQKYGLLYYFGYDGGPTYLIKGLKLRDQFFGDSSSVITSSKIYSDIPKTTKLFQNYPNPFNPATIISFDNKTSQYLTLKIYSITGQVVRTIFKENYFGAGRYSVEVNLNDFSSGSYIYELKSSSSRSLKKMTLIK